MLHPPSGSNDFKYKFDFEKKILRLRNNFELFLSNSLVHPAFQCLALGTGDGILQISAAHPKHEKQLFVKMKILFILFTETIRLSSFYIFV